MQYHVTYRLFNGAPRTGVVKYFKAMSADAIKAQIARRHGFVCKLDFVTIISIVEE